MTQEVSLVAELYKPVIADATWQNAAACANADPDSIFPEVSTGPLSLTQAERDFIGNFCGRCAVKSDCLASSFIHGDKIGIFGGVGQRHRAQLLKKYRNKDLTVHEVTAAQDVGKRKPSVGPEITSPSSPKPSSRADKSVHVHATAPKPPAVNVPKTPTSRAPKAVQSPRRRRVPSKQWSPMPVAGMPLPPLKDFLMIEEASNPVMSQEVDHTRIDLAAWLHDNFFGSYPLPVLYAPFRSDTNRREPQYIGSLTRKPTVSYERLAPTSRYASRVSLPLSNVYLFPSDRRQNMLPFDCVLREEVFSIDALILELAVADQRSAHYPKMQPSPIVTIPKDFDPGFVIGAENILKICGNDIETIAGLDRQRTALLALKTALQSA